MLNICPVTKAECDRAEQCGDPSADYCNRKDLRDFTGLPAKTMEVGEFHWRDGWYFKRERDGSVRMQKRNPDGSVIIGAIIPVPEWASIVCSVSEAGESGGRWTEAQDFHSGPAATTAKFYVARSKGGEGYAVLGDFIGIGRAINSTNDPMKALRGEAECFPDCLMRNLGGHARVYEAVGLTIRSRLGEVKSLPNPDDYFD